jgi:hypothetical protein
MLTNEELRAALYDVLSIKRALRQSQLNEAWIHLRALELRMGRGLRVEPQQEQTDAVSN